MELQPLAGLWAGIENDLAAIGIATVSDLRGQSPDDLLARYCALVSRPLDPFLRPCFVSLIQFAERGVAEPWWRILRNDIAAELNRLSPSCSVSA